MSEFDSPNYAEYVYDVKSEGKIKLFRRLMIVGYVLFLAAYAITFISINLPQLIAPLPIFGWMLVFFTWRYVSFDRYFEFEGGMLSLGNIRVSKAGRKKTEKLRIHVKEASFIGPYNENKDLTEGVKLYDFSESPSSEHRIILLWDNKGEKSAVLFEGTRKIANLLASFCENTKNLKGQIFHG